ncbi:phage tail tape measure protein [Citrobacter sp. RHBSTW-00599]|uniref:phage tail tape measure protein n=1 Tax=Citrobacter sp. RHBSTW-00599 TaxID=2742657 RepID=UPI0015EA720D|nr:phage tail tape measure protein [Citrobacter sp. RHBSTW-00599]QLY02894.1 phage tail tape measure protein [Citrobacter sp. RHBSTW-00599]
MSDVASLSVALHLNSAAFKSQITDAYQKAGQASKKFNGQATAQANELADAISKTVSAARSIGFPAANADQFSGATRGAGQLNFVLHEVAAGSNVASSSIINALIPAVHSLKGQLDGSAGGWKTQLEAAKNAAAELASAAQSQIAVAQAERQAAINKVAIAEKTIAAAKAQRDQAIALDEYYAKQAAVNKQFGLNVSYQDEHLKNERAILEANKLEASGLEKLKAAKAGVAAAELAETGGKAALTAATEAAAAANTQLTVSQRIAATSSRALGAAMSLLGGPVGIGLTVLAAGGTYLYSEFKKAEEQTKKLNAAVLDLNTSSLVSADDLKRLNGQLGDTENSVDAVTAAAKGGFSGQMLTDVATLANAYAEAGGSAQDLVNSLTALRGDPVAAMQKLTAQGVALTDATIQQVIALNKSGDAAQASQIIIEAALEASRERAKELGVEVDKTAGSVNNLGNTFAGMGLQASKALIDSSLYLKKLQDDVDSASARYIAASKAGWAQAENTRIKNAADLKNYIDAGTSAADKRAEAIKKLNNSIYASGSDDYKRILKGINDEYDKAAKKEQPKAAKPVSESAGQRALEQAQQQNAVLREQAQSSDKLTASASQLAAFNEKISQLKGQHLTADQQSLVNMQGQIRAQLQANALLEKEAALRKLSEKYQQESRKWREEANAMKREADQGLGKYSLSDRESADAEARLAITNRFEQRRAALENDFTDHSSAEYQARLADLESAKQRELQITQQSVDDKLDAEKDYTAGFRRGAKNWVDSARDANSQMAGYAGSLFDGMTDSLAAFATTGKLNFKSFTVSILSDLAKIATRIALSSALQSIFGAVTSSYAGGGSTPSGAYDNAASGINFNAKGGVYDSPSLSAYSGGVYNSPQVFAFAKGAGVFGEAGPEAIMPLTRASDGSLGVRATGGGGNATSGAAPQVHIVIQSDGNTSTQSTGGWEQFGKEIGAFVDQRYRKLINSDLRPGGAIWNSTSGRR